MVCKLMEVFDITSGMALLVAEYLLNPWQRWSCFIYRGAGSGWVPVVVVPFNPVWQIDLY